MFSFTKDFTKRAYEGHGLNPGEILHLAPFVDQDALAWCHSSIAPIVIVGSAGNDD